MGVTNKFSITQKMEKPVSKYKNMLSHRLLDNNLQSFYFKI